MSSRSLICFSALFILLFIAFSRQRSLTGYIQSTGSQRVRHAHEHARTCMWLVVIFLDINPTFITQVPSLDPDGSVQFSSVAQSCPTPSNPMDCSLPGSSVHGIFQARILEWGAIANYLESYKSQLKGDSVFQISKS